MPDPATPSHPAQQAPLWVLGWGDGSPPQELETVYPQAGDPFDQWTIRFTTRSGVQAFVTVHAAQYTPDHVAAAITPQARHIEQIARLHGPAE